MLAITASLATAGNAVWDVGRHFPEGDNVLGRALAHFFSVQDSPMREVQVEVLTSVMRGRAESMRRDEPNREGTEPTTRWREGKILCSCFKLYGRTDSVSAARDSLEPNDTLARCSSIHSLDFPRFGVAGARADRLFDSPWWCRMAFVQPYVNHITGLVDVIHDRSPFN